MKLRVMIKIWSTYFKFSMSKLGYEVEEERAIRQDKIFEIFAEKLNLSKNLAGCEDKLSFLNCMNEKMDSDSDFRKLYNSITGIGSEK